FVEGYRDAMAPRRNESTPAPAEEIASHQARKIAEQAAALREPASPSMRDRLERMVGPIPDRSPVIVTEKATVTIASATRCSTASALSIALLDCQGDAPSCEVCGAITVRNGSCYKCLNCGHSMGCS
ncbi:MAG: hypothetical protein CVV40_00255, partial [Planctomycetes bacterium HGW-Planctomycetes-2]